MNNLIKSYLTNPMYQNMIQLKSNMASIEKNMNLILNNISNNYIKIKFYLINNLSDTINDVKYLFEAYFEKNCSFYGSQSSKVTLYNQPYIYILSRFHLKNIQFPFIIFDMKTRKEIKTNNIFLKNDMELCLFPKNNFCSNLYSHEDSLHFYKLNFLNCDL